MADTRLTLVLVLGIAVLGSSSVSAFGVGVGVDEARDIDTNLIDSSTSGDSPPTWQAEVKNTGSTTMIGRLRLDIMQGNRTIYRAYSDTLQIPPGGLADRQLTYVGPPDNRSLEARLVFDHGAATTHIARQQFQTHDTATEEGFDITTLRAYRDRLYLAIDTPPDVETAHLHVQPTAPRRFEQVTASPDGGRTTATIPYTPPIQDSEEVRLRIGDSAGKYHYTTTRRLEPLTGWKASFTSLYDSITARLPHMFFT